jgi:hypothetical protein
MATINAYVDSLAAAGKKAQPGNMAPGQVFAFACTFEVAAADAVSSVYRVANLPANLIPYELCVMGDDALDITYFDVGLYLPGASGAVVDQDCFSDDLAVNGDGIDSADLACNALSDLPIDDIGKKLWEITSVVTAQSYTAADHPNSFDLALTAMSEPGAAATVSVRGLFIQG